MMFLYAFIAFIIAVLSYSLFYLFSTMTEDTFSKGCAVALSCIIGAAWFITLPVITVGLTIFFLVRKLEPALDCIKDKLDL